MNLPEINERTTIVEEASVMFISRHRGLRAKYGNQFDDIFNAFSQAIINLLKESKDKVYLSDYQKEIEEQLEKVDKEFTLTYGEKVKILLDEMKFYSRMLVKAEREI